MKKLMVFLLVCISLTFCGCNNFNSKIHSATSSISDSSDEKIADNVCFRKGNNADDEIVLTSKDIMSVISKYDDINEKYVIDILFNADGTKKFGEITKELAETNGVISIWVGDEKIASPNVQSEITGGECEVSASFYDLESVSRLVEKMHAKS